MPLGDDINGEIRLFITRAMEPDRLKGAACLGLPSYEFITKHFPGLEGVDFDDLDMILSYLN